MSKISENTAATTAMGHEPKKPPKKRHMITVCKFSAVATANWKTVKPNMPMRIGNFLPCSSDNGENRVGPQANPRTYKDNASVPTSVETPNLDDTTEFAVE